MRRRIELFRLFGFPIRIDLSWLLILLLVTYSLAAGYFPANHPGLPNTAYWAMGFVAAMGLFASILFHELSHSLMARHYDIKIEGITLFIFGGVAEMKEESPSPKVEFLVALMGPVASFLLAIAFLKLSSYGDHLGWNRPLVLIFYYLGFMNGLLALFNIVPAFPLDGGRMFRSLLWAVKKDYFWATRISALIGQGFGWVLVGLGAIQFLRGSPLSGIWYVLIGLFLRQASQMSVRQVQLQEKLEKVRLSELIEAPPVKIEIRDRLVDVLGSLGGRALHTQYPVVDKGHLVGALPMLHLAELKNPGWEFREVAEFLDSNLDKITLRPDANAWEAFQKMREGSMSVIFVVERENLAGWVTMERLLALLRPPGKGKGKQKEQKSKETPRVGPGT